MFEIKNLNIEQTVRVAKGLKRNKNYIIHFVKKITVKCFTLVMLTHIIPLTVTDITFSNQNIMHSFFQDFITAYFRNNCKHCRIFICLK